MTEEIDVMAIAAGIQEQNEKILLALKAITDALEKSNGAAARRDNAIKAALENIQVTVSIPELPAPNVTVSPEVRVEMPKIKSVQKFISRGRDGLMEKVRDEYEYEGDE